MLLDTLADQAAELDEFADDVLPRVRARVSELLGNVLERDEGIWSEYSQDIDLEVADFASIPRQDKDAEWLSRFSSLVLAAQMQAFAEIVARDVLAISEGHGPVVNDQALNLTKSEAKAAAKIGISKDAVKSAAERRAAARANK